MDDHLLDAFIKGLYGFGNLGAPYWFIGLEEGGGNSLEEIELRISVWEELGRPQVADLLDYHKKIGILKFFEKPIKLQTTWNKLIRIYIAATGRKADLDLVKKIQACKLGRRDGDTCLLELFPLSSPSTGKWLYSEISNLHYLKSRKIYREEIGPDRIRILRALISEYNPKCVIFYGLTSIYRMYWNQIAKNSMKKTDLKNLFSSKNDSTLFVNILHPAAKGVKNIYFEQVGNFIRKELGKL